MNIQNKSAIICGAGGFIGSHLVKRLKDENYLTNCIYRQQFDLRNWESANLALNTGANELYQLAGNGGGAGFVLSGDNDSNILYDSTMINLNIIALSLFYGIKKVFFSSSACVYKNNTRESSAYPANPNSDYGWQKLFSERIFQAYHRNYGLNVRIGRLHNIFGENSLWQDHRAQAPMAFCRMVAMAKDGDKIEIWGNGEQTRSFLYIDDCIEGIRRLMDSDYSEPLNIGSGETVTINQLVKYIIDISGKDLNIKHIHGKIGVKNRSCDNTLIQSVLGWQPSYPLRDGLVKTYKWIESQIK